MQYSYYNPDILGLKERTKFLKAQIKYENGTSNDKSHIWYCMLYWQFAAWSSNYKCKKNFRLGLLYIDRFYFYHRIYVINIYDNENKLIDKNINNKIEYIINKKWYLDYITKLSRLSSIPCNNNNNKK